MGIGSMLAEGRFTKKPWHSLQQIELLLTTLGGFSVVMLYAFDSVGVTGIAFSLIAHALIIAIGILTGFEIPLLIEIRNACKEKSENSVLGIDYIGAFLGTVLFAFYFYPTLGLINTAFLIALLNGLIGVWVGTKRDRAGHHHWKFLSVQIIVIAFLTLGLANSGFVNKKLSNWYMNLDEANEAVN